MSFTKFPAFVLAGLLALMAPAGAMAEVAFKTLQKIRLSAEQQLAMPVMIDDETRLDGIGEGYGRLVYHYTVVQQAADALDESLFSAGMTNALTQNYCVTMKDLMDLGINVEFQYYGKNGGAISAVLLTPRDCEKND